MVVGFIHHYGLGDNILSFQAMYECKRFYNCKLIVFGNALMQRLLQYCSFVDEVVNIHVLTKESALRIKEYRCNYILLTNPKSGYIRDLAVCDTQVITGTKFSSLFSRYCKTVPLSLLPTYRRMGGAEKLCSLVRKINPFVYEFHKQLACMTMQSLLDLCKIQTSLEHKVFITSFLQRAFASKTCSYLIAVNPFAITSQHTLPLLAWLKLMYAISQIASCKVLVITYPAVHDDFIKQVQKFGNDLDSELIVFQNTDDVLNLVEILSRVSLVISPSTGTIHVASNLGIPTLGLYSQKDTIKWGTRDKRYVIIDKTKDTLDLQHSDSIIQQVLQNLESLLENKAIRTIKQYEIND
ncbi:glycosyltransferase family 9 protein [Helicobacter aurati]|nr:glycosyltransferase family 9 protein [Helicobacter aurati]